LGKGPHVSAVLLQASLGGLTVLLRLPASVSIAHACLAQIFFCITVTLALVTSRAWFQKALPLDAEENVWISLPALSSLISIGFFLQLLMGAIMRHTGAGLAIPDFPTVFGGFFPPSFGPGVAIHFAHRMGAYTMTFLSAYLAIRIYRRHSSQLDLITTSGTLLALLSTQILLGALIILLKRPVPITMLHLAVGALILATSVLITVKVYRLKRLGSFYRRNVPVENLSWGAAAPLGSE
jgi:heme a synthase